MPPILVSSYAKHIATYILVIAKLSGTKYFTLGGFVETLLDSSQQGITCLKLTTEARE